MVLAFEDPDQLPPIALPGFICLIALILVLWLLMRVKLVRGQIARGSEPRTRFAFLRSLAAWPLTYPLFGLLAAGLAAGAWFLG